MSKTKKIFLFFLITFLGLFINLKPAYADVLGIADTLWGLLESQLDALDFGEGIVLQFAFFLILLLVESQAFLYLSATLLEWAINFPINLHNNLVLAGWNFTTGLTNLFFILIFVAIAIAYILRIETFQAKKALPRLIIVALLINFSLVFIGAMVDIVQITTKSIISSLGSDLPSLAIAPLTSNIQNLIIGYLAVIGTYIIASLIPFANVATMFALIVSFVAEAFLGTFSTTILLIVLGFAMGLIFFTYFIVFLMRVGIIWVLAILSPLAFACYILPGTQKYWRQWLDLLIEWLTFGIVILLLAGLGLKLFAESSVVPGTGPISIGTIGIFPTFTYNYLFLLIYLGVVFYFSKKYTPELAQVLISQAEGLTKRAAPMANRARKGFERWLVEQEKKRAKFEEKRKKGEPLTTRERVGALGVRAGEIIARPARWGYRYVGRVTPERLVAKETERMEKEIEDRFGKDYKSAAKIYPALSRTGKIALVHYLQKTKGAAALKELKEDQLKKALIMTTEDTPHLVEDIVKHRPELIKDEEVGEIIQRTMVSKGREDKDVQKLIELGYTEAEAIRKAALKKAVDALKTNDIENLALETIKDEEFQEMVVRFKPTSFIRRIGEEKGSEYVEMLREKAKELGAEKIAKTNLTLLRQSVTNPGFRAVFPAIEGAKTMEEIEKLAEEIRKERKKLAEEVRKEKGEAPPSPPPTGPTPPGRPPPGPRPTGKKPSKRPPPGRPSI